MKKITGLIVCLLIHTISFAHPRENKKSLFHLSFIPPLSTNGLHSFQYTNASSFNLLAGISTNEKAFTLGSLSNIILHNANGFQAAGLFNYIGNDGQGFQAAGLINIAKHVKGVQFAGLVNIAETSEYPIGLINIIKNGKKSIAVTYDALGNTMISFRSGGKYTYGIVGIGYNHQTEGNPFVTEGGLGIHIPALSWFRINNELKVSSIGCSSGEPVLNAGYSLIPAFRIGKQIELFAGAGINYMESKDITNRKILSGHALWENNASSKLQQLYVGYQFGIQYIF